VVAKTSDLVPTIGKSPRQLGVGGVGVDDAESGWKESRDEIPRGWRERVSVDVVLMKIRVGTEYRVHGKGGQSPGTQYILQPTFLLA